MPVAITSVGATKDIAFYQNADFSRQSPVGATGNILNTDGQIWMGMTTPDIYGSTIAVVDIATKTITSITGDTGATLSGAIHLYGHTGSANAGSSVGFNGVSSTEMDLIVTDSLANTIIGQGAGNSSITGNNCVGLGYNVLANLTSGTYLVALGNNAMAMATSDAQSTALGYNCLANANGGYQNSCAGYNAGALITTAQQNTLTGANCGANFLSGSFNSGFGSLCLGASTGQFNSGFGLSCLYQLLGGSYQIGLGYGAGQSYNGTESSCIVIGNNGVMGESNVMRLGTTGSGNLQVNETFIAGIANNTLSAPSLVTMNASTEQMGIISYAYTATAVDYLVLNTDSIIGVTDTSAPRTITLPAAPSFVPQQWTIKDETAGALVNNITISGNGHNIVGSTSAATFVINTNGGSANLYWNGTTFQIF